MTGPPSQDDLFHAAGPDPWWFESFWFSFFVPDRQLMVYVYPWFRPNLGLAGGGVLAWDAEAHEPWNIVHNDYAWHLPCPEAAAHVDGPTLRLPQGVRIDVLDPGHRYRIRYEHALLSIDVVFTATFAANVVAKPLGDPQLFAGRIDQCGKVEGHLDLRGERINIDCFSMRDRSWGVRSPDNYGMHIGYFHATFSAEDAFLAVSDESRASSDGAPLVNGYLLRDGVLAPLKGGAAKLERDAEGRPTLCVITAGDEAGRMVKATGRSTTWFAYQPYPGMFNWSSLASWETGEHSGLGELQDTWHPDGWRRFHEQLRQQHAGSSPHIGPAMLG